MDYYDNVIDSIFSEIMRKNNPHLITYVDKTIVVDAITVGNTIIQLIVDTYDNGELADTKTYLFKPTANLVLPTELMFRTGITLEKMDAQGIPSKEIFTDFLDILMNIAPKSCYETITSVYIIIKNKETIYNSIKRQKEAQLLDESVDAMFDYAFDFDKELETTLKIGIQPNKSNEEKDNELANLVEQFLFPYTKLTNKRNASYISQSSKLTLALHDNIVSHKYYGISEKEKMLAEKILTYFRQRNVADNYTIEDMENFVFLTVKFSQYEISQIPTDDLLSKSVEDIPYVRYLITQLLSLVTDTPLLYDSKNIPFYKKINRENFTSRKLIQDIKKEFPICHNMTTNELLTVVEVNGYGNLLEMGKFSVKDIHELIIFYLDMKIALFSQ